MATTETQTVKCGCEIRLVTADDNAQMINVIACESHRADPGFVESVKSLDWLSHPEDVAVVTVTTSVQRDD